MDVSFSRRLLPIENYEQFDSDGWSEDLFGLQISNGSIRDARLGCVFNSRGNEFYDTDGHFFPATHVLVMDRDDFIVGQTRIRLKKKAVWVPTAEQMKALSRVVKKLPHNEDLRALLKGLRSL